MMRGIHEYLGPYRANKPGGPTLANMWETLLRYRGEVTLLFDPRKSFCGLESGEVKSSELSRLAARMAEALVRRWDLKKGERALVAAKHPLELLVLSTALARAGGIAVPLPSLLYSRAGELVEESEAELVLSTPEVLEEGEGIVDSLSFMERKILVGWERARGWESLFAEMKVGEDFFIPYTLKPSNVVLLVPRIGETGGIRLVMVTNTSMFFPLRLLPLIRWMSKGGSGAVRVLFSPGETAGWAVVTMGLFRGKVVQIYDGDNPCPVNAKDSLWVTDTESFYRYCQRCEEAFSPSYWINLGSRLPFEKREEQAGPVAAELSSFRRAAFLYDLEGRCSAFALLRGFAEGGTRKVREGLIIPGNKVRILGGDGCGEVLLRGPSLFPGFWNDLEETFCRWEDGWFRTGVFVAKRGPWVRVMGEGTDC